MEPCNSRQDKEDAQETHNSMRSNLRENIIQEKITSKKVEAFQKVPCPVEKWGNWRESSSEKIFFFQIKTMNTLVKNKNVIYIRAGSISSTAMQVQ